MEFSEELYISTVKMSQVEGYLTASAFTFILCDILSTLDDEIKYIWRSKWVWAKFLYLISRYLGPVILLIMIQSGNPGDPFTEKRRVVIRVISTFGCLTAFIVVNVISSMRVYALYNRSRIILFLVLFLWACELTVGTYSVILIAIDFARVLSSFPDVGPDSDVSAVLLFGYETFVGHDSASKSKHTRIAALAVCTTSALIYLTLCLFKLRDSITDNRGRVRYESMKDLSYVTPLAAVFVSNGAFAFLLVFGIELANTIVSLDNIAYYYAPTFPYFHAILSYVGSRLILNLRRTGGQGTATILKPNNPRPMRVEVHTSTFQDGHDEVDTIRFATHTYMNPWRESDPYSTMSLQPYLPVVRTKVCGGMEMNDGMERCEQIR